MQFWSEFVDLIYLVLFNLSVAFGGNMGMAIACLSLAFRLALLPLTLRLAYRSLETRMALERIQPALKRIRKRYEDDPTRVWEETARLHRKHGIRLVDATSFVTLLFQVPLFFGVFSAVRRGLVTAGRFLWIRDLTKPDLALALLCAGLTGVSASVGASTSEQSRLITVMLPVLLTLAFLARMASGIGIYSFASGLVGLVQALLVRRRARQLAEA